MNSAITVLVAVELISLMLAAMLAMAWWSFDRPRHALTWSAAFVVAAGGWAAHVVLAVAFRGSIAWTLMVGVLSMLASALLLVGFRQRAGLPVRARQLFVTTLAAVVGLAIAATTPHAGLLSGIPLVYAAGTLLASAATMMADKSPVLAERAAITMLIVFGMFDAVAGTVAMMQGADGDAHWAGIYRVMLMLTLPAGVTGVGLFAMFLLAADLADRMSRLATSDPLTGVLNRRGFEEAAERIYANAKRQHQPVTVVMADLDRFKSINDRYGHAAGDLALQRFVAHVAGSIRGGDLLGRLGGEEFAILLVNASPRAAVEAVDRIRIALGKVKIDAPVPFRMTASFGVTGPISPDDTLAAMIDRADHALYASKMAGRDRVTLAEDPEPPTVESPELLRQTA